MTDLTRRQIIGRGAAGAGAVLLGGSPFLASAARRDARRGLLAAGVTFEHGVASGVPSGDGALLWTRLTGLERSAPVELQVAADEGFRRVLVRQRALASSARDFAVKRSFRSARLKPGERYWYRFVTRDGSSPVGRFRTATPADSAEPVRIGFFSCQKWSHGYYTAHRGLAAEEDLDLVVSLGDYVYEEPVHDPLVKERPDRTGVNRDGDVQTLAEWRQKYRLYQSDPNLIAMQAAHPILAVWDDHEVENDYASDGEGTIDAPRRVSFAERKRVGRLAFFESLPVARRRDDPFRIYGSVRVGQAELMLLDTRSYRDPLACAPVRPCPQGELGERSILGAAQRVWLKERLAGSDAAWKVIGSQVMMMGLDVPAGVAINADQWDGYASERRELLEHVLARGVKDVAVVTGDIHTFFAGTVTTTGDRTGRPAATEFVGGSITSAGIAETLEGMGLPRSTVGGQRAGLTAMNPHIAYAELEAKGYGVLEARRDELLVTFRSPETVLRPEAPMRDLARFRVARGSTDVEVR